MAHPNTEPKTEFSALLRAARLAAGWETVTQAARAAGVAPSNLSELETRHEGRGWKTVHALIVRLRLPLEMFFPEDLILEASQRVNDAKYEAFLRRSNQVGEK